MDQARKQRLKDKEKAEADASSGRRLEGGVEQLTDKRDA
jgi:hypothetical protein